jgi:hypothetical protein
VTRADGWRLHVSHETRFDYNAPARASYNELRLTPRTERRQTALETKIATVPPAPQYSYVDYWGTQVVAFNVDRGHEMLSITGTALIDTQRPEAPEDASWGDVADASLTMADYLSHKLFTAPGPELAELAASLHSPRPLQTAQKIMERTHESLRYVRGVTSVHTSAHEAFVDGAGVCQDFAHLALAMTISTPNPTPSSARRSSGRATPGSRSGRGRGGPSIPRTTVPWGSATWPSGAAVTTPTCRRSRASTPATLSTPCTSGFVS